MRGITEKTLALSEIFVDEAKFPLLEIPESPVNQLRGFRTGPGRPVFGLDQGHREAAGGCIDSDPASRHSAPNDQDIKWGCAKPLKGSGSGQRGHLPSLPQAFDHNSCPLTPLQSHQDRGKLTLPSPRQGPAVWGDRPPDHHNQGTTI